jgi:hypothetical protein
MNLLRIRNEFIDQRELYSFKNFPFFNVRSPEYKIIILNDNYKLFYSHSIDNIYYYEKLTITIM